MMYVLAAWTVFGPSVCNRFGYNRDDYIVITITLALISIGVTS